MKRRKIYFIFPLLLLGALIYALSHEIYGTPPLGKLLDPFVGGVQNERDRTLESVHLAIDGLGLGDSAKVYFDDRNIPHIYARNRKDLYFIQGYVTASFRLWQMDFLTYASAGRLSEILGPQFLEYDRKQRRIGILEAARGSLQLINKDTATNDIINAYSRGVNAYIKQLGYKELPLEYKLLNYEPEAWSDLKTILILKYMANILSGFEEDYIMTNLMLALGEGDFNRLFPGYDPYTVPLVSDRTSRPNPALTYLKNPGYLDYSFMSLKPIVPELSYNPRLGSNSWVVSGRRTRSGHPMLCNDPHLDLSLPCIWMEMQLSAPDMNVYGVSIPGTPGVIIGFNNDIAWGVTNGLDDVKDWYKLQLTENSKKYEYDNKWIDLTYSVEPIKVRGQPAFYDTIYHTVHGPIVYDKNFSGSQPELLNYALKWELHNPSNEFKTFVELNRAHNYRDYLAALKYYSCPIQNFTFACKDGDIAVTHQGKLPIKWPGQGRFLLDGAVSAHLHTRYVPEDSLPHLLNPSCGYIVSANQHPTDTFYPYYYNGYYNANRALRIKKILDTGYAFDIDAMEKMQLDNISDFAQNALPALAGCIDSNKLTKDERDKFSLIGHWKGAYGEDDKMPLLFELWWKNISYLTWDELQRYSFGTKSPSDHVLLNMIRSDPKNRYFDRQATPWKEDAADIVRQAFSMSVRKYEELVKDHGQTWADHHKTNIRHLTRIPAFSRLNIPSAGCSETINAITSSTGPSWRMVVELGEKPKAYGIYAGGQSGNIGSRYYDDFVNDWRKGKYYPLYLYTEEEAKKAAKHTWAIK